MNVICKGAMVGCLAGVGVGGAWAYQADDTVDVALKRAAAVGGACTGAGALVGLLVLRRNRRRLAVDRALANVLGPLGLNRKKHLSRRVRRQLRRFDVGKLDAAKLNLGALTGSARRRAGKAADTTRQRAADVGEIARQRAGGAAEQAAEIARRRAANAGEIARQGAEQATVAASHAVDVARQRAGRAVDVARHRSTDAAVQAVDTVSHAWKQAREQAGEVADEVTNAAQSLVDA